MPCTATNTPPLFDMVVPIPLFDMVVPIPPIYHLERLTSARFVVVVAAEVVVTAITAPTDDPQQGLL
jgi:hypothetical protein